MSGIPDLLTTAFGGEMLYAQKKAAAQRAAYEQWKQQFEMEKDVDASRRDWADIQRQWMQHSTPSGNVTMQQMALDRRTWGEMPTTERYKEEGRDYRFGRKEAMMRSLYGGRTPNPYKGAGERATAMAHTLETSDSPLPDWDRMSKRDQAIWRATGRTLRTAIPIAQRVGRAGGTMEDVRRALRSTMGDVSERVLNEIEGMLSGVYYEEFFNIQSPTSPFYQGGATPPNPERILESWLLNEGP